MTAGQHLATVPPDWRARFADAYTAELQAWVDGLDRGETIGPSAWDGYAATSVVEVGVNAVRTDERLAVGYVEKPALYR